MLAVSSLHRRFKEASCELEAKISPPYDRFASRLYGKALRQLIRDVSGAEKAHSRAMSLICGVLFTLIEVLQGSNVQALAHLDGIIKLLNETSRPKHVETHEMFMTDVEEDLRPVISRLDVQASVFSTTRPPGLTLPPLLVERNSPRPFTGLDNAEEELTALMMHMSYFKRTTANAFRYETAGDIPIEVLGHQNQLAYHFCRWWQNANTLLASATLENNPKASLLQIHYHASWTMLQGCLHAEETIYDGLTGNFAEIVRLSTILEKATSKQTLRTFVADTGRVFPLYWTTLRCRDGYTRRAALHLLRACSQEGVWVPEIQARVAERVIEIEEGLPSSSAGSETASLFPRCEDVLEFQRIHSVGLDVDMGRRAVRVTYHRRLNGLDGEWNLGQEWLSY